MSIKNRIYLHAAFAVLLLTGLVTAVVMNDTATETINDCKVIDLQQQQLISGSRNNVSTSIRYLVVTDKETFICERSILNGKFDNSNVFFSLKIDSTHNFKVCGLGKSLLFDYRNILKVK